MSKMFPGSLRTLLNLIKHGAEREIKNTFTTCCCNVNTQYIGNTNCILNSIKTIRVIMDSNWNEFLGTLIWCHIIFKICNKIRKSVCQTKKPNCIFLLFFLR